MLPAANQCRRQPVPISHLTVGLECGGSDSFSGSSANPALGKAMDLLVRQGGTAVLTEPTELLGMEGALARRARTCLLYTSPSPRDRSVSRMPSSA